MVVRLNIPDECEPAGTDPQAESLWAAEIERRAREVADGKVSLIDAANVHAEIARRLRTQDGT
ncbi:MAG TPA: addiction module protein [Polyangia bacterium]|jgi:Putative addiction module component.|nr:addiction module protein [Polyangia bacterium]